MNFQPLADFLDYYLPMLGIPGSDTVIYRHHEELFRHKSGYDSLRFRTPVRSDAIYNIYSCSSVATCIAAMQLVERGELLVTDPLYAFIPEFRDVRVAIKDALGNVVDTLPTAQPITLKHLFTMTSGIGTSTDTPAIRSAIDRTNGRACTLEVVKSFAETPLEFQPGSSYLQGLSHDVLGAVVEIVSGVRLSEYISENLFLPLGMEDTSFHIDTSKFSRLAAQYELDRASNEVHDIPAHFCSGRLGAEYDSGGYGIATTVDDFAMLADALACGGVGKNGNRIISEFALDVMTKNMLDSDMLSRFSVGHNYGYGYGYGFNVNMEPASVGNFAPSGEISCDGEKLCYLSSDRSCGISIFHAEHLGALHQIVIPRLRNLVYSCIGER